MYITTVVTIPARTVVVPVHVRHGDVTVSGQLHVHTPQRTVEVAVGVDEGARRPPCDGDPIVPRALLLVE